MLERPQICREPRLVRVHAGYPETILLKPKSAGCQYLLKLGEEQRPMSFEDAECTFQVIATLETEG